MLNDTLISMTAAEQRRALRNLSHIKDQTSRALLQEFLFAYPRTSKTPSIVHGAFGRELSGGTTVGELLESDEFDSLSRQSVMPIEVGENTRVAFDRIFANIASVATEVEIIDPYLGSKLHADSSYWWLVERLFEMNCSSVTIYTNLPVISDRHRAQTRTVDDLVDLARKNIEACIESTGAQTRVQVVMYFADPKKFHHRRIRFKFENSSLGFLFEKGADAFARTLATEQHLIQPIRESVFLGHFQPLSAQRVARTIQFPDAS
jgi:hypothetical protein